jgi:hypothetical protein
MDFLVEQISNLSGTAVVALFAYLYGKAQMAHHEASLKRVCETFDKDAERRSADVKLLADEIRTSRPANNQHNSGVGNG